jgi:alpha-galactosidase
MNFNGETRNMRQVRSWIIFCSAVLLFVLAHFAQSRAQAAPTPPMGWNSWNHFNTTVSDAVIRAQALAMSTNGMQKVGYTYVIIDDGWQGTRDSSGNIQPNSNFPNMPALVSYVHSLGLKIGIYSSPGPTSCAGFIGSYQHESQDALTFVTWGMDYLKYDWCSAGTVYKPVTAATMTTVFTKMYNALQNASSTTGNPVPVYSIDDYGMMNVWQWGASTGASLWRTSQDVEDDFYEMAEIGFGQMGLQTYSGPGHWNDPDMLQIGNGGMLNSEYQTQMTLWCILSAPLIAGNDLTTMSPSTAALLTNSGVVAVDQDSLGVQGKRVWEQGPLEVWVKPLSTTGPNPQCSTQPCLAVGVFNRGIGSASIPLNFRALGISASSIAAQDLWAGKSLGSISNGYLVKISQGHGAALLKLGS